MNGKTEIRRLLCLLLTAVLCIGILSACARPGSSGVPSEPEPEPMSQSNPSRYIVAVEDEPDTVDFQCTSIHYTVAQNVFDRLVEMENDAEGKAQILPSLAESWDLSEDHRCYTFRLRKGVRFSNGSPLTASDVEYTFTRLLTHPDSCNQDVIDCVLGAHALESGEADRLEGFQVLSELAFTVTLEQPFEAFLACLSMPGASILDAETTEKAGDRFGIDPTWTIGTGSFILRSWVPGKGMILTANEDCWKGAPKCAGLDLRFMIDQEEIRLLFENGGLDLLDLEEVGRAAEYFLHGSVYRDRLYEVHRVGITYIALNETVEPLADVRVRKALQLALNRRVLLDAAYGGRGWLENGIMPHGLSGFNPDLAELPYDPEQAKSLLAEAGYPDGFAFHFSVSAASPMSEMDMVRAAVSMWEDVGVHASVDVLDAREFMRRRKNGEIECFQATWTADFNDPDNFFYTFFGNEENTRFRSLCYPRTEIMQRVRDARMISDPDARLEEYRELERIIVQEDCAWIPLFTRLRFYVTSERLNGMCSYWNGSVKNMYRVMSITENGGEK